MLRRITFPLIALLLLLSVVAGCGGAAPTSTTPAQNSAPTTGEQKQPDAPKGKQTTYPVTVKDDLCRVRKGPGAKNMAVVRHFAINLVRN